MSGDEPGEAAVDDPPTPERREAFGPADFAAMTPDEWEASFDPDTWITGESLLDRVESELRSRVARRDVFAVIERIVNNGETCLVAYSDEGYALVRPSGTVEGFGTVLRDVKPTVALCSMPDYDPESVPDEAGRLPDPDDITIGAGDLGNKMLQAVSFALVVAAAALIGGWVVLDVPLLGAFIGVGFGLVALFLLFTVANARLSERYRAEEYRDRLRAVGLGDGERPSFVPADERDESPESTGQ